MKSIAIYVEGGGDSTNGKAALRQGFDKLFSVQKDAARNRRLRWKTVLCGGRNATYDAFLHAAKQNSAEDVLVLLVDAEGPVEDDSPGGRVAHVATRDRWKFAEPKPNVYLMTQCMEAWIVADPDELEKYYGNGFKRNALPSRQPLDDVPKVDLFSSIQAATKGTQKGNYNKILHASELLKRIRPDVVSKRCTSFQQVLQYLTTITGAS